MSAQYQQFINFVGTIVGTNRHGENYNQKKIRLRAIGRESSPLCSCPQGLCILASVTASHMRSVYYGEWG